MSTPKFKLKQLVFINTKDGLELREIEEIVIRIKVDKTTIYYCCKGVYDTYREDQILGSKNEAKKRLTDNINQIQLSIN